MTSTGISQSTLKESLTHCEVKCFTNIIYQFTWCQWCIKRCPRPRRKHCWQRWSKGTFQKRHLQSSTMAPRQRTGLTKSCQHLRRNVSLASTSLQTSSFGWQPDFFTLQISIPHNSHFWYANIFLGLKKVRQKSAKICDKICLATKQRKSIFWNTNSHSLFQLHLIKRRRGRLAYLVFWLAYSFD